LDYLGHYLRVGHGVDVLVRGEEGILTLNASDRRPHNMSKKRKELPNMVGTLDSPFAISKASASQNPRDPRSEQQRRIDAATRKAYNSCQPGSYQEQQKAKEEKRAILPLLPVMEAPRIPEDTGHRQFIAPTAKPAQAAGGWRYGTFSDGHYICDEHDNVLFECLGKINAERARDSHNTVAAQRDELLAACKALVDVSERIGPPDIQMGTLSEENDWAYGMRTARAAIANTEGKQTNGCVCDEINMRHCPVHGQEPEGK
jgi:hypothetical protein